MSLITRFNGAFKAFASEATGTFRTVFGGTTQSNDLTDQVTADFKTGWEIVGTNDEPTIEDFNAMGYTLSQVLAYIHQVGIIEWSGTDGVIGGQDYYANKSYIGYGGNIYLAILDSGGSIEARIPTNNTYWQCLTSGGFKNYIINGKKTVNQRGLTSTDNSYNQDRWYKAGNNWYQGVEGDNNLISGKKYTLSWVGVATASYYVGTATSLTINEQSFTSIDNGGNFTLTISSGQNLWIKFASDETGSTFNFVQLEEGSAATPFENRPYGLESSLCQRYYEKCQCNLVAYTTSGQIIKYSVPFSVVKRTAPTISDVSGTYTNGSGFTTSTTQSVVVCSSTATATGASSFGFTFNASAEL